MSDIIKYYDELSMYIHTQTHTRWNVEMCVFWSFIIPWTNVKA